MIEEIDEDPWGMDGVDPVRSEQFNFLCFKDQLECGRCEIAFCEQCPERIRAKAAREDFNDPDTGYYFCAACVSRANHRRLASAPDVHICPECDRQFAVYGECADTYALCDSCGETFCNLVCLKKFHGEAHTRERRHAHRVEMRKKAGKAPPPPMSGSDSECAGESDVEYSDDSYLASEESEEEEEEAEKSDSTLVETSDSE